MSRRAGSSTAFFVALALLSGCPPPGKGPKAEAGYQRAAPVLAALETYHARRNSYPDSLGQLAPDFLGKDALAAAGLEYTHIGDGFEVRFRYFGPGVNDCVYRGSDRRWTCSGYF